MIVFLTKDLMIQSSALAAARAQGISLVAAATIDKAIEKLNSDNSSVLFVDLQTPGLDVEELIAQLTRLDNRPTTIAFAQHVEEDLLALANSDVIQSVLTRGQFSHRLPQIVEQLANENSASKN